MTEIDILGCVLICNGLLFQQNERQKNVTGKTSYVSTLDVAWKLFLCWYLSAVISELDGGMILICTAKNKLIKIAKAVEIQTKKTKRKNHEKVSVSGNDAGSLCALSGQMLILSFSNLMNRAAAAAV